MCWEQAYGGFKKGLANELIIRIEDKSKKKIKTKDERRWEGLTIMSDLIVMALSEGIMERNSGNMLRLSEEVQLSLSP
jgi:hypothetical protein